MTDQKSTGNVPTAMKDTGGTEQGYRVLSYLISGPVLYGGLGWLGDHFLHTTFLLPVGIVVGTALSVILIIRRYGQVS
ncbi:AtpZ/AtpI family protein [Granulicoccus sp. GXG6511]|uniref:AtpZ/AtpI family protein n=1 Tax=Granulicoccus sp. GXG6511 TaxID=3381351 RepID=UPI003D7EB669